MEDGLVLLMTPLKSSTRKVLILVVMEDGLVLDVKNEPEKLKDGLNPCCNGRWSRTYSKFTNRSLRNVLILVVMEDGLVQVQLLLSSSKYVVLILVVMEDGLVLPI